MIRSTVLAAQVLQSMCWSNFGSVFLKYALLKSPATTNASSGYVVSSFHKVQWSSFRVVVVSAWGGIYAALTITEDNSLGRLHGLHLIVRYSRSGKQKGLRWLLSQYHHELLIMKHTPPLFFPERYLFLNERWTENPTGWTDPDSISWESHVSMKQSTVVPPFKSCVILRHTLRAAAAFGGTLFNSQTLFLLLQVIAILTTRGHIWEAFDSIPYWHYQRI
jgi:hypothetical protein